MAAWQMSPDKLRSRNRILRAVQEEEWIPKLVACFRELESGGQGSVLVVAWP